MVTTTANAAQILIKPEDPNTVHIHGQINQYDWGKFERVVKDKEITKVHLTSPGGVVETGNKIAEWVYERPEVKTEASGQCVSQCAVIWLAGHDHVYNGTEELGFHLPFISNVNFLIQYKEVYGLYGMIEVMNQAVVDAVSHYVKYINNPEMVQMFLKNVKEHGYGARMMWKPTAAEILQIEGNAT